MRAYRLLLRLYPASFRNEYGGEMASMFARRRTDSASFTARASLWIATLAEVAVNAPLVHLDILRQDLRYVARTLKRSPGFAFTAIVIVALGIGATTAAFTVTDFVLLRPLVFPEADRLVTAFEVHPGFPQMDLSPANYRDLKAAATTFEALGAYRGLAVNLAGSSEPQHVQGAVVTSDVLPLLGIQPLVGRFFTTGDDRYGADATVILSYRLWQTQFAASEAVVGQTILLDSRPYTVIGVMPQTFAFPDRDAQLWAPMQFEPREFEDRNDNYLWAIGRLRRGVPVAQARADVALVAAQLRSQYARDNAHTDMSAASLRDQVSTRSRVALAALTAAALCVLLIACANLANLLLARAAVRARELTVRTAIGAGRERLTRQLLTESMMLALAGGAIGVVLATAAVPLLSELVPARLPTTELPTVDVRILIVAILATTLTGIVFGLAPVVRVSRNHVFAGLASTVRAGGGAKERTRSTLVAIEIIASVVLLVATGLLVKALWRVQATDIGFSTTGVLTMRTALPMPKYEATATRETFYDDVLDAVRALPGVSSAAYVGFAPMRGGPLFAVGINGAQPQDRSLADVAAFLSVTPGYFRTMGIPIRHGRDVSDADSRDRPSVAVVSESFVRRYWATTDPIGQHFTFASSDRVVVGVVGNARIRGLERPSEPQVYVPAAQMPDNFMVWHAPKDLVVRTTGRPTAIAPAVRAIIRRADPQQPVSDVRTLDEVVTDQTAARTAQVRVLAAFAAIAFVLAAVGIHGLLSFAVSQRTQEIGVRIALGAQPRNILAMVMGNAARLGAVSAAIGMVAAYAAGRSMEALLAGVEPDDAQTFAVAVALVAVMLVVGTLVPTLRALRVDPISAIRTE